MSARLDAISALEQAIERLTDPEPLGALDRRLLIATLAHARECVQGIEELKRARRTASKGAA